MQLLKAAVDHYLDARYGPTPSDNTHDTATIEGALLDALMHPTVISAVAQRTLKRLRPNPSAPAASSAPASTPTQPQQPRQSN